MSGILKLWLIFRCNGTVVMFKYSISLSDIYTEINTDEMIWYMRFAPKWPGGEKGYI